MVVGESIMDVVRDRSGGLRGAPGGSPANVAVGLGRLGVATTFLTHLGRDDAGGEIRSHLEDSGSRVVVVDPSTPTSSSTATIGADGSAEYEFDIAWNLTPAELSEVLASKAPVHLHTGSIAVFLRPGADAITQNVASPSIRTMSFDPNIRPELIHSREEALGRLNLCLRSADLIKASDEDIEWISPGQSPLDVAEGWLKLGPTLVVVTMGAEGVWALGSFGRVYMPSLQVQVVDTVGAGDSFMSALIEGWLSLMDSDGVAVARGLTEAEVSELLDTSNTAAAITVSRRGAQPPTRTELAALKHANAARRRHQN